jgi:hypothetical protein
MSDWPKDLTDQTPFGVLSTAADGSGAAEYAMSASVTFTAGTGWGAANYACYCPVVVRQAITVYQLGWVNGSSVAGNFDVGIYDKALNRLVSSGSTAQAGTSTVQLADITDTSLPPGLYYLAMSSDTASGNPFLRMAFSAGAVGRAFGCAQQASAFPLPSTATFAAFGANITQIPLLFGAIEGATI